MGSLLNGQQSFFWNLTQTNDTLKFGTRIFLFLFAVSSITSCTIGLPVYAAQNNDDVASKANSFSGCAQALEQIDQTSVTHYLLQAQSFLAQKNFLTWVGLRKNSLSGRSLVFDQVISLNLTEPAQLQFLNETFSALSGRPGFSDLRILLNVQGELDTAANEEQIAILKSALSVIKILNELPNVHLLMGPKVDLTAIQVSRSLPAYFVAAIPGLGNDLFLGSKIFSPEVDVLASLPIHVLAKQFFSSPSEFHDEHSDLVNQKPSMIATNWTETRQSLPRVRRTDSANSNLQEDIQSAMERSKRLAKSFHRSFPNVFSGVFDSQSDRRNQFFESVRSMPTQLLNIYFSEAIANASDLLGISVDRSGGFQMVISFSTVELYDFEQNNSDRRRRRSSYQNILGSLDVQVKIQSAGLDSDLAMGQLLAADPYFYPVAFELLKRLNANTTSERKVKSLLVQSID